MYRECLVYYPLQTFWVNEHGMLVELFTQKSLVIYTVKLLGSSDPGSYSWNTQNSKLDSLFLVCI